MRLMRKRPSGVDKDILVKEFAIGEKEIEILKSLVGKAIRYIPDTLETNSTRNRLLNINRELSKDNPDT